MEEIHNDHKELVNSVLNDQYGIYKEEQKQQILELYKELNKIPKKDWDKQSTIESLNK